MNSGCKGGCGVRVKKEFCLLTFVFLCFFIVYAVSPLTCCLGDRQSHHLSGDANKAANTIRLFVLDVLFSTLSQQNDTDGDDPADDHSHVLLTKKRALRSSSSKMITEPAARQAKHFEMSSIRGRAVPILAVFDNDPAGPGGFQLLHSGISPPSV